MIELAERIVCINSEKPASKGDFPIGVGGKVLAEYPSFVKIEDHGINRDFVFSDNVRRVILIETVRGQCLTRVELSDGSQATFRSAKTVERIG